VSMHLQSSTQAELQKSASVTRMHLIHVHPVTLDALGRTEEAKALRERYGVTSSDDLKPS
jgi:hypothetical protein